MIPHPINNLSDKLLFIHRNRIHGLPVNGDVVPDGRAIPSCTIRAAAADIYHEVDIRLIKKNGKTALAHYLAHIRRNPPTIYSRIAASAELDADLLIVHTNFYFCAIS